MKFEVRYDKNSWNKDIFCNGHKIGEWLHIGGHYYVNQLPKTWKVPFSLLVGVCNNDDVELLTKLEEHFGTGWELNEDFYLKEI